MSRFDRRWLEQFVRYNNEPAANRELLINILRASEAPALPTQRRDSDAATTPSSEDGSVATAGDAPPPTEPAAQADVTQVPIPVNVQQVVDSAMSYLDSSLPLLLIPLVILLYFYWQGNYLHNRDVLISSRTLFCTVVPSCFLCFEQQH